MAASQGQPLETQHDALVQDYVRRSARLRRIAWLFTAVPLLIFVALSFLVVSKAKEYKQLLQESEELQQTIGHQKETIQQQKSSLETSNKAIEIVKQQSSGPRANVVVYRLAVAQQVTDALQKLGYTVEDRVPLANPALANKPVDTLSYGCAVSNQDIRTVAAGLTNAGIPIRRISPAERNPDPNLIQVVSSRLTAETQNPLTIDRISSWSRPSKPCRS